MTKDYGKDRGVFNIDLNIRQGEVFGYVGTNGSGKTTTIRQIMGFIRPDKGTSSVNGLDSWKDTTKIMQHVSYIPGEIAFPNLHTGTDFLKLQAEYLGVHDFTYMNHVIELLQLDPTANLKRMSKGMKQKTAIVAALMADKEILVMDEPTTGLDPLMRDAFLELIREEKEKGRTIFMSSHIFEEIEKVCDRVAMIKDGYIVDTLDLWRLRHWKNKKFHICFFTEAELLRFTQNWRFVTKTEKEKLICTVEIPVVEINSLFHILKDYKIASFREDHLSLEQYFMRIYQKGADTDGKQ
ncbi:MAG: ATP-binding cassette domain-containing protein [Clostridiales bacterium]|nr:ATP-binding cassette domain-containing protein [Clostridiales bacterium]